MSALRYEEGKEVNAIKRVVLVLVVVAVMVARLCTKESVKAMRHKPIGRF
jgi:hypothetical protein